MPDKYSFRDGNAIYSTETPVSGSEIPKERETYTQTKRKTINKRTKFLRDYLASNSSSFLSQTSLFPFESLPIGSGFNPTFLALTRSAYLSLLAFA